MSITVTRNPNLSKNLNAKFYQHEIKEKFKDNWFTGLKPSETPGFDKKRQKLFALPLLNIKEATRQDVLDYFNNSWTLTELLFQSIKVEEAYVRSPYHGLRHPMMFYYGHPAVLYLNKMRITGLIKNVVDPYLEKVLETGVDEMSWDDMSKNEMKWPRVEQVHEYRKKVYELVKEVILTHPELDKKPEERNVYFDSALWSLWMGFEHEKIHFETSSVLLREMPLEFLETPEFWPEVHESKNKNTELKNSWVKASGREVEIGKDIKTPSYGWDNEYGKRKVTTLDFEYTKFQITNRDFFEFVKSGAYIEDKYWASEGLHWRKFRNTKRPTFWVGVGAEGTHEYELRVLFDIIPMPWNWPCEVNYHEAIAYCHWKQEQEKSNLVYRLFTEAEVKTLMKNKTDMVLQKRPMSTYNSLEALNEAYEENFNFKSSSARNVDELLYGNTWHWLMDQFNPLEGFKVTPIYDDFSTPCFDGKHQMMMGGSFISCGDEASIWSRFHFRPHFYQHAGFRMARTLDGSKDNGAKRLIETTEYVHETRNNVLDQMNNKEWWKKVSQPLEFSPTEISVMMDETKRQVLDFYTKFNNRPARGESHDSRSNTLSKDFNLLYQGTKNFPANPEKLDTILNLVFNDLLKDSQLPGHPAFAAYMAGSGNFLSNIAQLIAQTINPFTGHYMMAPGPVAVETEVIGWFMDMIGFNIQQSAGYLTTGTSLATLHALMVARNAKLKGVYDYNKVVMYAGSDSHHCVAKAWVMSGFKKENIRYVKLNNHKMDVLHLESLIKEDLSKGLTPLFINLTLGSTKTGSVDPINEIVLLNKKFNLWLHADGAYGVPFLLINAGKDVLKGISSVDSIAFDPHKALALPYGTGCLLVKDKAHMIFDYLADDSYMPPVGTEGMGDFSDISPELSRDFRGLRLWLPLKVLGVGPFVLNLEEKLKLKEEFITKLKDLKNLSLISKGDLSIVTFKHNGGSHKTKELMARINDEGTLFLSGCEINGEFAIRICFLGFRLHYDRLERFMNVLKELSHD